MPFLDVAFGRENLKPSTPDTVRKLEVTLLASVTTVMVALGCSDATAPRSRVIQIPVFTLSKDVSGPPDVTIMVGSAHLSPTPLYNFPYRPWGLQDATGDEAFTSGTAHFVAI